MDQSVDIKIVSLDIPRLRFSEYEGNWHKIQVAEAFVFKSTYSITRENLSYENGKVRCIHYGDIHTIFPSLLSLKNEDLPFINQNNTFSEISEDKYCKTGDLILADASENLLDVGKAVELVNINNHKVLSGLHTILARPKVIFYLGFLGYLFQTNKVRAQVQKEAQGSKVLSISATRLRNIILIYPNINEQKQIVQFLTLVDEKIQALKKKRTLLEDYKKGVMQKLFSQKLRFKDENGGDFPDWQEIPGGELFNCVSKKGKKELPILAVTQDQGAIPRNLIDYDISVTEKSIESYKEVKEGDFIISLRSFQGGIEYSKYNGICSPAISF